MGESEMTQIGRLQADVKNLCRSIDEVKETTKKIEAALNDHRVISAERAQRIDNAEKRIDDHEVRLKKVEVSLGKLMLIAAISAGGATGITFSIEKIVGLLK